MKRRRRADETTAQRHPRLLLARRGRLVRASVPPLLFWIPVDRPSLAVAALLSLPRVGPAEPLLTPASCRAGDAPPRPSLASGRWRPCLASVDSRAAEVAPWGGALDVYGMSAASKTLPREPGLRCRATLLPSSSFRWVGGGSQDPDEQHGREEIEEGPNQKEKKYFGNICKIKFS
jgi:hypothetical protein